MRWPKWFWDLRDAWRVTVVEYEDRWQDAAEGFSEPLILDPLLGRFVFDEPAPARELAPEEEARIRKIVSDSLWAEREGKAFPRCEDHLDGMDGAAVFFCDRSSGHGGFHRDRENKVTWVSDSEGK